MKISIYFLICTFFLPALSNAEVFKCQRTDGSIYYQDRDCINKLHQQTSVLIFEQPRNEKDIKQIEKKLSQQRKNIIKQQKQYQQQKDKDLKKLEQEKKQRVRMRVKCAETKRKIAGITQQYRNGYTIKQSISLDGKLARYKDDKQRYCKYE